MHKRLTCIILGSLLATGCAQRHAPSTNASLSSPTTKPVGDPKSFLTLDQIQPPVALPKPVTTQSTQAPLDALELFAQARSALISNPPQPYTAIGLLNRAVKIDPYSYDLWYSLGEAETARVRRVGQKAIEDFEHALSLRPDNLELQSLLGREYSLLGEHEKALEHLRLAIQTTQYKRGEPGAALTDFALARELQDQGYDRAALDRYDTLIRKVQNGAISAGSDPELAMLIDNPEFLWLQVGELYEKHGQWSEALAAYQPLAERDPSNFELQARVVRCLVALGRRDEAIERAAEAVMHFRASSESIALLKEVYEKLGQQGGVADELRRLHEARPQDRAILFSLADVLGEQGRSAEAQTLLASEAAKDPGDTELARRLFWLYARGDDVPAAARLLTIELAARPDSWREIVPLWDELLRPLRKNSLRLATLQNEQVPADAQAAKLFLISRVADLWRRDALARSSLEQAVKARPVFSPAFRELNALIWSRPDLDTAQKKKASQDLALAASEGGQPALAAEIRGLALVEQKDTAGAVDEFAQAVAMGSQAPDLMLTYARALHAQNNDTHAEALLWKLVSDRPAYEDAWTTLFALYRARGDAAGAHKVLTQWLTADPGSVEARVLQAGELYQQGQVKPAQAMLQRLFNDRPDNVNVLTAMLTIDRDTGHPDNFIATLEDFRAKHPDDRVVVEWLVDLYASQHRTAEAGRVLDETRAAVAGDPELLYQVAHLYDRVGQKKTGEEILQQVVQLDPTNAAASNDLGYSWADEGRNLDKAESLIRVAVAAEPDNQSFLDSLGWVLYKRSKFDEARARLEQAIGPAALPDPVVLDHFGDTLYRLGQKDAAAKQWQRSLDRIEQESPDRDDLKQLRLVLVNKLSEAKAGKPVDVAPVVETTVKGEQAKQ